jgi:hypothetical protein
MERANARRAQSLIEVLIGVALGTLFIVGAAGIIAPSLQTNQKVAQIQTKTELASELMDNLRAWSAGTWNSVLLLATGTSNLYYLNVSSSPFTAITGTESIIVSSTTYTRSFYLTDAYRDGSGNATTTAGINSYDPSTKQITISLAIVSSTIPTTTYTLYLTRSVNNALAQASWLGGSGQNAALSLSSNTYANATSITISAFGQIQLSVPAASSCVF